MTYPVGEAVTQVVIAWLGQVVFNKWGETMNEKRLDARKIVVRTVDGSVIRGKVNLAARERVSDLFTGSEEPFIVIFDASLGDTTKKVFFVNKRHILWVEPED